MSSSGFYRKKPAVVRAYQMPPMDSQEFLPDWVTTAYLRGKLGKTPNTKEYWVITLEGTMYSDPGAWLIEGVKGELYFCQPDIFQLTYEACEAPAKP